MELKGVPFLRFFYTRLFCRLFRIRGAFEIDLGYFPKIRHPAKYLCATLSAPFVSIGSASYPACSRTNDIGNLTSPVQVMRE